MEEQAIFSRDEATAVRRRIGEVGREALEKLAKELPAYDVRISSKGRVTREIPKHWVERYEKLANQLRREYRLDGAADLVEFAEPAPTIEPPGQDEHEADPLQGLKLVCEDAA